MKRLLTVLLTSMLLGWSWRGAAAGAGESLAAMYEPGRWSAAECAVSCQADASGAPVLEMRIPIDYEAGEVAYPIGWPRMSFQRRSGDPDLAVYDYLEFDLAVQNTRSELDYFPVNWVVTSGGASCSRRLLPVPGGKLSVQIPVTEVPDPADWKSMGVNISESDYAHGDVVVFRFSAIRLRQLRECRVAGLRLVQPGIYRSATVLPLEVAVEGPPAEVAQGIPLRLSAEGRLLLELVLRLPRGKSSCLVPLDGLDLAAGMYELALLPDAPERGRRVTVRVVEPFWSSGVAGGQP